MSRIKRAKICGPGGSSSSAKVLPPADAERVAIAGIVLSILSRQWFGGTLSIEANRMLPSILLAVYEAQLRGAKISKREACAPLKIDPTKTGARYIAMAMEHGLLVVETKAGKDGRKDLLSLTPTTMEFVAKDLMQIAVMLGRPVLMEHALAEAGLKGVLKGGQGAKELWDAAESRSHFRANLKGETLERFMAGKGLAVFDDTRERDVSEVDPSKLHEEPDWETFNAAMSVVAERLRKRGHELGEAYELFRWEMTRFQHLEITVRSALALLAAKNREFPKIPNNERLTGASDWRNFHYALQWTKEHLSQVAIEQGAGYDLLKTEMAALQNRGYTLEVALANFPAGHTKDAPSSGFKATTIEGGLVEPARSQPRRKKPAGE